MLHYYHAILLGFTFVFFRNKSKDETTYYILHTTLSALKTIENKSEKMLNLREKKLILLQHYIIIILLHINLSLEINLHIYIRIINSNFQLKITSLSTNAKQ